MTNFVVGNGIHLPSLVVSTVGVVSPTVLDATDSVVLSILQRYFVSLIMLANSIVAVRSSLSKHVHTYVFQ